MMNCNPLKNRTTRRILSIACAAAFVAATTLSLPGSAHAGGIVVPTMPDSLKVLPPNHPFLLGKATGTQDYVCLPAGVDAAGNPAFAWKLFTPEATLFRDDVQNPGQLITHFFSPNPDEINIDPLTDFHPVRATWQSSKDSSAVWARTLVPGDTVNVTDGAIPWLKLTAVGHRPGPSDGDLLTTTTFIQRVNTSLGVAPPADTCDSLQEVGKQAFRAYTADYIFYTDQ